MSTSADERSARVRMKWGVQIPMRDGVCLNGTLYLPEDNASPVPAIVTMTPYVAQSSHDRAMYFAANGYAFLAVDVRGRGNSGGDFRPLINEAHDGFDVVEWLARQPYCNGKVSMWGGSYSGYVQWVTAKEVPPHLVTIVPAAAFYAGVDFPCRHNIPGPYLMQWLILVWGRTVQEQLFWNNRRFWNDRFRRFFERGVPFRQLDVELGCPSTIFQECVAHPHPDEHWDRLNPSAEEYSKLQIPVLTITGIYDSDQPGALMHYREHIGNAGRGARAQHYLIIGPWDHAGTRAPALQFAGLVVGAQSAIDLPKLHLEWYAWTQQRGPKPEFLRKNVVYYLMGADEWRYADSLEEITDRTQSFYLHADHNPVDVFDSGLLDTEPPLDGGPDWYVHDPRDTSPAEVESELDPYDQTDQTMTHALIGRQLVYHSGPFPAPVDIGGFFKLTAWLSIDQPDTDIRACVYEITIEGKAIKLSSESLRARYRESLRQEKLISTQEAQKYEFKNFTFVARRLGKGSRLRLVIGPVHSIYSQRNFSSGGVVADESVEDARIVTVKLFRDAGRRSRLVVPFGK